MLFLNKYENLLEEISKLGGLYYLPEEIAILCDIKAEDYDLFIDFMTTKGNEIYNTYTKAKLQTEVDIRENIFLNAKNGVKEDIEKANMIMNKKLFEEDEPKFN